MMRKELSVRTCWGYDLNGDEEFVRMALRKNWFPVEALVTQEVGLEQAAGLIRQMLAKSIFYCKALINMEK
jgi:threonine dehydrogenase-like Zn-dependent dehydrogenase